MDEEVWEQLRERQAKDDELLLRLKKHILMNQWFWDTLKIYPTTPKYRPRDTYDNMVFDDELFNYLERNQKMFNSITPGFRVEHEYDSWARDYYYEFRWRS